jgi:hypothetical protein
MELAVRNRGATPGGCPTLGAVAVPGQATMRGSTDPCAQVGPPDTGRRDEGMTVSGLRHPIMVGDLTVLAC